MIDIPEVDGVEIRKQQEQAAMERAQLHFEVFVRNKSGAVLLEEWDRLFLMKCCTPNAAESELRETEAVRRFIRAIHQCIALAKTGVPKK